ncbi:hypothetical protein EBQ90_05770 [bacterium]|nr:hypothetical protein [bacterium]
MNLKYVVISFCSVLATLSAAKDFPGVLRKVDSKNAGELAFECEIHTRLKDAHLKVSLDTQNHYLRAELDKGVTVKGFASEMFDEKTGTTYYFIQGGFQPYFHQLTLAIRNGGEWAEFKRTYGGESFICH